MFIKITLKVSICAMSPARDALSPVLSIMTDMNLLISLMKLTFAITKVLIFFILQRLNEDFHFWLTVHALIH